MARTSAGSVSAVLRRRAVRLSVRVTVIALGAAATGCTTFSDNDAVARVGDVELSDDELTESLSLASTDHTADADAARQAVTDWIRDQIVESGAFDDQYSADPSALGVACLDVAVAVDQADAEGLLARVEGGEDWDDVVAPIEEAIGYDSAQPCQPLATFGDALGDDVAERLGSLVPGAAPQVIDAGESGGFAVIRARELANVDAEDLVSAMVASRPAALDAYLTEVYVDPRVGSFDPGAISVVAVD